MATVRLDDFFSFQEEKNDIFRQKILIVDDQSFNIEAMMIILHHVFDLDTKNLVSKAFSGMEALEEIVRDIQQNYRNGIGKVSSYTLIIMDCSMPMMDGYETTEIIRSIMQNNGMKQPIISALTGHTDQHFIDQSVNCGMNQVLKKPVDHESIGFLLRLLKFIE